MSLPGSFRDWRCPYCGALQQKYVVTGYLIVETVCRDCRQKIRLIVRPTETQDPNHPPTSDLNQEVHSYPSKK